MVALKLNILIIPMCSKTLRTISCVSYPIRSERGALKAPL